MLLFVILANKYEITTYIILEYWYQIEVTLTIWITLNSWQQALSPTTFVVPNLSQSDYLNLPVTVDKLLATKKKARVNFAYLVNKYGITLANKQTSPIFNCVTPVSV